jgi:hypothetical protein
VCCSSVRYVKSRFLVPHVLMFNEFMIALNVIEDFLADEGIKYLRLVQHLLIGLDIGWLIMRRTGRHHNARVKKASMSSIAKGPMSSSTC